MTGTEPIKPGKIAQYDVPFTNQSDEGFSSAPPSAAKSTVKCTA